MVETVATKSKAQRRVDRIRAFREELQAAGNDGALTLTETQRTGLEAYHEGILSALAARFDVDTTDTQRQMSWGMRIASSLGAMALAIAVYLFFYRIWGALATPSQVGILVAGPLLAVAGMEACSRRERTLYFTGLLGLMAFALFVLNVAVLGTIFNITPAAQSFLAWGLFGIALAYAYGLRLMLVPGLACAVAYLTCAIGTLAGVHWMFVLLRPETLILAGLITAAVPFVVRHGGRDSFPPVYRLVGLLATFVPVFVLSHWGQGSFLPLTADGVEILYQVLGFVLAGLAIWGGIRLGQREVTYTGCTFFVLFLYAKFFDWWWELLPRYVFFLVLGLVAVGLLLILGRARKLLTEVSR